MGKIDDDVEVVGAPEIPAKRETWTHKIDFLLACIGFSVGLGNVWRFPYLCYKNGGGAFLIPYLICVVVGGIPLFFLEVAIGQFMSQGGHLAWRICPILQGIGWATTIIVFFLNCYYNVILAWAFYYFFASFTDKLPWDSCDNYWNTPACRLSGSTPVDNDTLAALTTAAPAAANLTPIIYQDPTTEFWEYKVLNISDGIHEIGNIKWDLCLCLILAWLVVYLCICQGIRTSGKVMYFTATSPYIFMLILLIRNSLLEGSLDGILYYLMPDFEQMSKLEVWVDAGTQIFFSYSISLGALTALGSYNKWNHNSYRDSIIFACTNSGTSIFAGFVIFTILGYMANLNGTTVDKVAEGGPGLAFIAYPKAVSQMPIAPLWSVLFFLMVILLGLDSQFVGVEGLATAFMDTFPTLRRPGRREIFIGVLCLVQLLVGLSMVTEGGMYVFQLFDYYSGSRIILLVATFECVAVAWIYGIERFYDNIEMMFGFRISPYMKISWVFMSPVFCLSIFIMSTIKYSELSYTRPTLTYVYPWWAVAIGWSTAALSAACIPIVAIYKIFLYNTRQPKRGCVALFKPEDLLPHQLRPQDHEYNPDIHMDTAQFSDFRKANDSPPPYATSQGYGGQGYGSSGQGFENVIDVSDRL